MALSDQVIRDGDQGFVGFASRMNPLTLPAGILQRSENMRLDRGVAQTRKGLKRLADDISLSGTPLTIPFTLTTPGPIVRNSYGGGVFASGVFLVPEESIAKEAIILIGPDRAFCYVSDSLLSIGVAGAADVLAVSETETLITDTNDEIYATAIPAEISFPTSGTAETVDPTDEVSVLQAYNRFYIFREADRMQSGWGTAYVSAGISVVGTVATVTMANHGYSGGMRVRFEGGSVSAFDGVEYDIVSAPTGDTFTIEVPAGTASDSSVGISVRRVKPPLYWNGDPTTDFVRSPAGVPDGLGPTFKHMRSTGWASYINNRLIVPDGRQNLMVSDVFDPDTFDPFWQSFRVGSGGTDYVVGVHPWVEGTFLVFCRKSIWLATVNQFPSTDGSSFDTNTVVSKLELLTDEIGCSARRTITTAGSFIYFLSDAGVYRLDSRLDLKLRGDTRPLSDPISDQLSNLNASIVDKSVALFHQNRFYLAVPLSKATTNNGIFIYNQLLEAWESRDYYGLGVDNFLVANTDDERRIFITNQAGKLMLVDQNEDGTDDAASSGTAGSAIPGRIVTRRMNFQDLSSKRFLRGIVDTVLPQDSTIATQINLFDPDETIIGTTTTNTSSEDEDYHLKQSIRYRAHAAEMELRTTAGRPAIRSAAIEASPKSLPETLARNAN